MTKTLDEIAVRDHACVVVDSDEQHWEVAAGFVTGGITRHEKILYHDAGRSTEPVLRRLREDNVDVARYLRTGQLLILGPREAKRIRAMTPPEFAGLVDRTLTDARTEGYTGVRISDEAGGAGRGPSGAALAEYDRMVHAGIKGHPVTMLCQYERTDWAPAELTELCEMHPINVTTPAIYDDGLLRITRTAPFSTRVSGEIDFSNRHLVRGIIAKELERALRATDETDEIQVHLESLRFADVTSIAQFVLTAESFPQSHKLVLYGAQPRLRRVLDRCGARFTRQLTLRESTEEPRA